MGTPSRIHPGAALAAALWLWAGCTTEFELTERAKQGCVQCSRERCADELDRCEGDPRCLPLQSCVTDCRTAGSGFAVCDAQCMDGMIEMSYIDSLSACQAKRCADDCDRRCGGWMYRTEECATCMHKSCCDIAAACGENAVCWGSQRCLLECAVGDWGCYNLCFSNQPVEGPVSTLFSFFWCGSASCSHQCRFGEAWHCVDEELAAPPPEAPITIHALFQTLYRKPIGGMEARVCVWLDDACAAPLAIGMTDAAGQLLLTLEKDPLIPVRVDLRHPDHVPAMLVPPMPFNTVLSSIYPFILPTPEEASRLSSDLGVGTDPALGSAQLYLMDCGMTPAPNLALITEAAGATSYCIRDGFPDTNIGTTDTTGHAGFYNLPPGLVEVQAAYAGDGGKAVLHTQVLVRPGILSLGFVWPR